MSQRIRWWKSFFKAQISAFIGGLVDYAAMLFFTEIMGVFYPISICLSGLIGAVVNFSLNRKWTFQDAQKNTKVKQLQKFIFVLIGSITLKSVGTYLMTEHLGLNYKWSRIIIDGMVSLGFNFTLQRYWVFKPEREELLKENLKIETQL